MRIAPCLAVLLALWNPGAARAQQPATARSTPARIVGGPGGGCIAGAVELPSAGPGYQTIRASRSWYWGHPDTIAALQTLAARAVRRGAAHAQHERHLPPARRPDAGRPRQPHAGAGRRRVAGRAAEAGADPGGTGPRRGPQPGHPRWPRRGPGGLVAGPCDADPLGRPACRAWTACWSTRRSRRSFAGPPPGTAPGCAWSAPGTATPPTCTCTSAAPPTSRSAGTRRRRLPARAATPRWTGGSRSLTCRRARRGRRRARPCCRRHALRSWPGRRRVDTAGWPGAAGSGSLPPGLPPS